MFEHRDEPLLPRRRFYHRLLKSLGWAALVAGISLLFGTMGYHCLEDIRWVDALHTVAGKLFASFYALYSGLVLIGLTGLLLAPGFHRILHAFHETRR